MVIIDGQLHTVDICNGVIEVIESSKEIPVDRNAVLVQNAGNTTARFNNGWTFRPNAMIALGGQSDMARYNDKLCIEFLDDGDTRRIEIWPLVANLCPYEAPKTAC